MAVSQGFLVLSLILPADAYKSNLELQNGRDRKEGGNAQFKMPGRSCPPRALHLCSGANCAATPLHQGQEDILLLH